MRRSCRNSRPTWTTCASRGDSVGARIAVVAEGVPPGWGEPVYDRLDADIAYAMMGINAVKGVEIGAGFAAVAQRGSEHGDEMTPQGFVTNNAGGILGGISTGQDIVVSIAIKPTSSSIQPRRSIDRHGNAIEVVTRTAGTIPVSASARRRLPKRCWRWC
jgi:chorismate synthase